MSAPRPVRRTVSDADVHAAERYLDALTDEDLLSPEEMNRVEQSIEAIRRGEMSLAEFEEKYEI